MKSNSIKVHEDMAALFANICETGELSDYDRQQLKRFLLSEHISEDDRRCINRLLYSAKRGELKLSQPLQLVS